MLTFGIVPFKEENPCNAFLFLTTSFFSEIIKQVGGCPKSLFLNANYAENTNERKFHFPCSFVNDKCLRKLVVNCVLLVF